MSRLAFATSAITLAAMLAGCATTNAPKTVKAECRIFDPAPHAVKAATRPGQRWVDKTIETGVRVCGHPRPSANPGE